MATPPKTKEQMAIEIAKLEDTNLAWATSDERRRKEFAKAFNWVKNTRMVGYNHMEQEPQLPSWEQIFVQLGKMLVLEELKNKVMPPMTLIIPDDPSSPYFKPKP